MAINITTEQMYVMDVSNRPTPEMQTYKSLTAQFNPFNNGISHPVDPQKELISSRYSDIRAQNAFGDSTWGNAVESKSASHGTNALIGALAGGFTLGGLGAATSNHLMKKLVKGEKVQDAITKYPILKALFTEGKSSVNQVAGGVGGALGALAGGVGGYFAKTTDGNRHYGYDQYYDPNDMYDGEQMKYGSDDHIFITDTNIDPFPKLPMPDDIANAVSLEHPVLKYLPITSATLASALAAVKDIISVGKPNIGNISGAALLGVGAGTILKNILEKHYSKPYMNALVNDVNNKFKTSSEQHEFISDTNFKLMPANVGPKDIESVLSYQHPFINALPVTSTALSLLVNLALQKGKAGVSDSIASAIVGGGIGNIARLVAMEKYMDPYRDKYIDSVKDKYKVKTSSVLDGIINKTKEGFLGDPYALLDKIDKGINHLPGMHTLNNLVMLHQAAGAVKPNDLGGYHFAPFNHHMFNIPESISQPVEHGINKLKEKATDIIGQDRVDKIKQHLPIANVLLTKTWDFGMLNMAAQMTKPKITQGTYMNRMDQINSALSDKRYIGNLGGIR